eukprot:Phypoly_transcript_14444.p1 GENE.Phypoly_transcript_14444~~Phypoly_transcript_14444.p1  ORF type:complete len:283 (+),score=41.19 Phypoly_transcript_14444:132-980(+)
MGEKDNKISMNGPGPVSISLYSLVLAFFSYAVVKFSRTKFDHPEFHFLTVADVFDTVAPYIVMFFYVYFYYKCREREIIGVILRTPGNRKNYLLFEMGLYFVLVIAWISGHGIHLAANSVHNVLDREYFSHTNPQADHHRSVLTTLYHVVDFWDEKLGHEVWHTGIMGMQAVLVWIGGGKSGHTVKSGGDILLVFGASIIYGLILFVSIIEGGTYVYGIPYLAVILSILYVKHTQREIRGNAILLYFFIATWIAALGCGYWGWYTNWTFPEFSDVGFLFTKQ